MVADTSLDTGIIKYHLKKWKNLRFFLYHILIKCKNLRTVFCELYYLVSHKEIILVTQKFVRPFSLKRMHIISNETAF